MTGRVLVTGSSSGLGLATAKALREGGNDVVVHVRDASRTAAIGGTDGWSGVVEGDWSQPDQVRAAATELTAFGRFDAVVHNAGVLDGPSVGNVNVLAPYLLTTALEPPRRLIFLSSSMHHGGSLDLTRLRPGSVTYSDSKLWLTALAMFCATRWPNTVSHAVDPGWVPTRMGGPGAPDDLVAGHETQVWLATEDDVTPRTGGYWHHRRTRAPHEAVVSVRFQKALVAELAAVTGERLP